MITTTINKLRAHGPCKAGWEKFLRWMKDNHPEITDDQEFPMVWILDSNGLMDCIWALRSRPDLGTQWRLLAFDYADRGGQVTESELEAAKAAIDAAGADTGAAGAAARAAWAAAAEAAAHDAHAAAHDAHAAAWTAERERQTEHLRRVLVQTKDTQ